MQYNIVELGANNVQNGSDAQANSTQNGNDLPSSESCEKLTRHFVVSCIGDDVAEPANSERMHTQIDELAMARAKKNALEGIALIKAAEEALAKIQHLLSRMMELATQAADGTVEDGYRTQLQCEFNKLCKEIDRISSEAIWKKGL